MSVNHAVKNYNAYTSFCVAHPGERTLRLDEHGQPATPCYLQDGTPSRPVRAPRRPAIANPYWNAPVQSLFDPNANVLPVQRDVRHRVLNKRGAVTTYRTRWSRCCNYKHDKLDVHAQLPVHRGRTVRFAGAWASASIRLPAAPRCRRSNSDRSTLSVRCGGRRTVHGAGAASARLLDPQPVHRASSTRPATFVEPSPDRRQPRHHVSGDEASEPEPARRQRLRHVLRRVEESRGRTRATRNGFRWYGAASGKQAGNFYNPGNAFQQQAYPYFPVTGAIAGQQAYGTGVHPVQVFLTASVETF